MQPVHWLRLKQRYLIEPETKQPSSFCVIKLYGNHMLLNIKICTERTGGQHIRIHRDEILKAVFFRTLFADLDSLNRPGIPGD